MRQFKENVPVSASTVALVLFVSAVFFASFYVLSVKYLRAFEGPGQGPGVGGGAISVDANNNLGVGTSTPRSDTKLLIVASSTDSSEYALQVFQPDSTQIFYVRNDGVVSAPDTFVANINAANVSAGTFGSSTGGGNFTFPANLTVDGDVTLGNSSGTDLTVGGGTGKIDAGTIDPIYSIGGARYATYLPAMTGVKEETAGVIALSCPVPHLPCRHTIDFHSLEKGSDLWLFSRVTDLKDNFDKLTVLLTPSFNGTVWYEKVPDNLTLTIFGNWKLEIGNSSPEVSYRLTAPRFDYAAWPNAPTGPDPGGFEILDWE